MTRCGCASSWTPSVPEEVSLQLSSFTFTIWPLPLFFKEKATGQLEGSHGWDLAYGLAMGHTRRLYFGWRHSSTLPLEQQYINIFQICWSKEQEHGSLYISNWTFTWESKIQSSGHWAKSNSVFYIYSLPLAPLILKNYTESKSYSNVCIDFIFAAKAC